jgi:hypothetical protein
VFSKRPIDARGRWAALTLATVVLQFAYWPMVGSVIAGEAQGSGGLWLGLAVTPSVFLVLALTSRHPRAPGATARAMGLFLLIGLPLALVNIIVGLTAGFGAGAVAALRREEDVHDRRTRVIFVLGASVYLLTLATLTSLIGGLGDFAVVSGAVLPLAVVGLADELSEARRRVPEA